MKNFKPFIVVIAIFMALSAYTQEMPRHVYSAGGGNYESAVMHVSWTIGQAEPLTTTYKPTVILGSGFQQQDDIPVFVKEVEQEAKLLLYPNPCNDLVRLDIEMEEEISSISWSLFDFSGKLIINKEVSVNARQLSELINLGALPPGVYNLRIVYYRGDEAASESIKLIRN